MPLENSDETGWWECSYLSLIFLGQVTPRSYFGSLSFVEPLGLKSWAQKHACKVLWVMWVKVKNMFFHFFLFFHSSEYLQRKLSKCHQWSILMDSNRGKKMTHVKPQECRASIWMFSHLRNGICCCTLSVITRVTSHGIFLWGWAWPGLCRTHHWTIQLF